MAIAVPVATKLVQDNQDTRNKAAGCGTGPSSRYQGQYCCTGYVETNCRGSGMYAVCDCVKASTPVPTASTKSCTVRNCSSGSCKSSTVTVGSNESCPSSNCTSDANCCERSSACAANTCIGQTCSDGCGGQVQGTKNCTPLTATPVPCIKDGLPTTTQSACCSGTAFKDTIGPNLVCGRAPTSAVSLTCASQGGRCLSNASQASMTCGSNENYVKTSDCTTVTMAGVSGCCVPSSGISAPTPMPKVTKTINIPTVSVSVICTPGAKSCSADGKYSQLCSNDGMSLIGTPCPNGCSANGVCNLAPTSDGGSTGGSMTTCDPTKYKGVKLPDGVWGSFEDEYTAKCICGSSYHYNSKLQHWACGVDPGEPAATCTQCPGLANAKGKGDADCSNSTTLNDFSVWRGEFLAGGLGATVKNNWRADFDCDGKVSLNDFSIWRPIFINSILNKI